MDKIKRFLKLTKYHFLRLPVIRSIVRWMNFIIEIPNLPNYHTIINKGDKETICGENFGKYKIIEIIGDEEDFVNFQDNLIEGGLGIRKFCGVCASSYFGHKNT